MRTSIAAVAVLGMVLGVVGAEEDGGFPIAGRTWTYEVVDGKKTVTAGAETETLSFNLPGIGDQAVEAWRLEGWEDGPTWIVDGPEGFRIVGERRVGFAGVPTNVVLAEVRWNEEEWTFPTMEGCMLEEVRCKRVGTETIDVPAGSFESLKIEIGTSQTFWVALGVGIVRRVDRTGGPEVVWELESTK